MNKNNFFQLKKRKNIDYFDFSKAAQYMLENFSKRSQNILKKRFGMDTKYPLTLSEIGKENNITRERVRQIIQSIIKQIKLGNYENYQVVENGFDVLKFTISQNSGIIRKKDLIEILTENKNNQEKIKQTKAIDLFLACHNDIEFLNNYKVEKDTLVKSNFDFNFWEEVENVVINLLQDRKETLSQRKIIKIIQFSLKEKELLSDQIINFLKVSRRVKQNVFGDWGLYDWMEINPKNVREKAYLVLKKKQKPYHFKKIAQLIDKVGLNNKNKKSHFQTVHNELIKDDRFVLVGRGTYALTEWGYKKGTVKDIIQDILDNSQKPLSKEEIIKQVLIQKQVKPATVSINLSNYFNSPKHSHYFVNSNNNNSRKKEKYK